MRYIRDQVCDAINIFLYLLVNYCYNGTDVKRKKLRVRKSENESESESKGKRIGLSVNAKWGSIEEDHLQISRKFFEWHEKWREKKGRNFGSWLVSFHPISTLLFPMINCSSCKFVRRAKNKPCDLKNFVIIRINTIDQYASRV